MKKINWGSVLVLGLGFGAGMFLWSLAAGPLEELTNKVKDALGGGDDESGEE